MKPHALSLQNDLRRRFTRAIVIAQEAAAGVDTNKLAEQFEMSPAYAAKLARRAGVRKNCTKNDVERRKKVASLYKGGVPIKKIAEDTGVERKTIFKIAKEAGIKMRSPSANKRRRIK